MLGPGVALRITVVDEINRRVRPERIIRDIERDGGRALIGLIGVQSNQETAGAAGAVTRAKRAKAA